MEKVALLLSPVSNAKWYQAKIAQLVEHNLAKVGVASSSLVFRSIQKASLTGSFFTLETGGIRSCFL
jgi:hypothetical protein